MIPSLHQELMVMGRSALLSGDWRWEHIVPWHESLKDRFEFGSCTERSNTDVGNRNIGEASSQVTVRPSNRYHHPDSYPISSVSDLLHAMQPNKLVVPVSMNEVPMSSPSLSLGPMTPFKPIFGNFFQENSIGETAPTSSSISEVFWWQVGIIRRNLEPSIQEENLKASLRMSGSAPGHIDVTEVPARKLNSLPHSEEYSRRLHGESLYEDWDEGEQPLPESLSPLVLSICPATSRSRASCSWAIHSHPTSWHSALGYHLSNQSSARSRCSSLERREPILMIDIPLGSPTLSSLPASPSTHPSILSLVMVRTPHSPSATPPPPYGDECVNRSDSCTLSRQQQHSPQPSSFSQRSASKVHHMLWPTNPNTDSSSSRHSVHDRENEQGTSNMENCPHPWERGSPPSLSPSSIPTTCHSQWYAVYVFTPRFCDFIIILLHIYLTLVILRGL